MEKNRIGILFSGGTESTALIKYYKDKNYIWTVSYIDETNKQIFDDYENNVKILK